MNKTKGFYHETDGEWSHVQGDPNMTPSQLETLDNIIRATRKRLDRLQEDENMSGKLPPTKLYELNAKPNEEELSRMIIKLQSEGYYAEDMNKDGVIVKGANWEIKRHGGDGEVYARGFKEDQVWMIFLGWIKLY